MASFQGVIGNLGVVFSAVETQKANYREIYEENCHRIYSLSFWMTDNELVAEQLLNNIFLRAFATSDEPKAENVDAAFITEMREMFAIGSLTLTALTQTETTSIRSNMKRVHLERAVVQLPATEKLIFLYHDVEGYDHEQIARLIGVSKEESMFGLHQARLTVRALVAQMQ
jgi:RNA polymerase sigma-70 factor (ECF subfamily)